MKEQLGPSSRFQYSKEEIKNFFTYDISDEYDIPFKSLAYGLIKELILHPFKTTFYIPIHFYTRLWKKPKSDALNVVWSTETTTKNLPISQRSEV